MNVIINRIQRRLLKHNKNWMAVICGPTGSGKSYAAIKIASLIDPEFNAERIVFTPEQFMQILTSGTLKKGSAVVFDEAGVGIPAREWYSIQNKMLGYILQTFRHQNLAILFTVPSLDFIDIQARKLFHAYIQTKKVDQVRNKTHVKFYAMEYNPRFGKIYFKYNRSRTSLRSETITTLVLDKPDNDILKIYEDIKEKYSDKLQEETSKTLEYTRAKLAEKVSQTVAPRETKKDIILREVANGKRPIDISREYGISYNYISKLAFMANTTPSHTHSV